MVAVSLKNITAERSPKFRVSDFSAEIETGDLIGVIGPNGSGKSTLAKAIVGTQAISAGEIAFGNRPAQSLTPVERAKMVGYLPQHAHFAWDMPVREAVELGAFARRGETSQPGKLDETLQNCDLSDLENRNVLSLSGGEQMRVHIARVIYGNHEVIVADEPCASLDIEHQHRTMQLLQQHARVRSSLVIIHDLNLAQIYCDRLLLLHEGRLQTDGRPEQVLTSGHCRAAFGVTFKRFAEADAQNQTRSLLVAEPNLRLHDEGD
ncbi:MAG: ABC transporter ATP-binding protein [Pseudomonadota bacterium]